MKTIYIMCGLPGSGKSTWAKKQVKKEDGIILSKDLIREMVYGNYEFIKEKEYRVKAVLNAFITQLMFKDLGDIIIDETNILRTKRKELLELINKLNFIRFVDSTKYKIVCVYCSSQEGNLERRMAEPKGQSKEVWEEVISDMKKSFEPPVKEEGFDELIEITIKENV